VARAVTKKPAKTARGAANRVAESKQPKDRKAALYNLFSAQSAAVEKEISDTYDLEDVSGFWPGSLVLCLTYGKLVSGFYVTSGPEQSAKTTSVATVMGQSFAEGTLIHKHFDVERAMRGTYMPNVIARYAGVPWSELRGEDGGGGHARYRWLTDTNLENVFLEIRNYLLGLPDKLYLPDRKEWFLRFSKATATFKPTPKHAALHEKVAKELVSDGKLSNKEYGYYSIGDDASFQVFYMIDSLKAMTLSSIEEGKKGFHQPGVFAKAMSDHLPYVKALLQPKHSVLFAVNQMYTNPMEKYGDPEYETGGGAIKLYSDNRCTQKPRSVPDGFKRSKDNGKLGEEPSVLGDGVDVYSYKNIRNIKGKFLPTPYIRGTMRIWSSGPDFMPGIDPVYDTFSFLDIIGLADLGSVNKEPVVKLANHKALEGYAGEVIPWMDFKAEILAECGCDTGAEPSELRALCFDLVESGEAFSIYNKRGSIKAISKSNSKSDDDEDDE
jgi:hypothetical protein